MFRGKCIVTVINQISETSMPFNEFVLYRNKNYSNEKHIVIVCSNRRPANSHDFPDNIEIYYVGLNLIKFRQVVKKISDYCKYKNMQVIIHIHQPRSGLLFHISSVFRYRKRTIFTVHSTYKFRDAKWKLMSIVNSLLANKITIVSNAAYDSYLKIIKIIKGKNIQPLPNGVDNDRIDLVLKDSRKSNKSNIKTIVYVSRFIPIKNHLFLLKILSKMENYKLVLIGEEDIDRNIRNFIIENKMDNKVEITGKLTRNEVFKRLQQADIYVSPSTVEGLPISVLEAMYVGLPVIISDIGPHREIANKKDAVKILPFVESEWVSTLENYLCMDYNGLLELGENCKFYALKNYSLSAMHQQYDEIYNDIIE